MTKIDWSEYSKIVVLSGAGISAASGIRTYRGPDGLWNDQKLVRLSDAYTFRTEPLEVWKFWSQTRKICNQAEPNAAHLSLVSLEKSLRPDQSLSIITQNIDGLHDRAGSLHIIQYHGSVLRTRCENFLCSLEPFTDTKLYVDEVPLCPLCRARLRPDIVLFNETIPEHNARSAQEALLSCDLFIAIGTSGTVYPASDFVRIAHERGARTILINMEEFVERNPYFKETILGKAELILPELIG
ncbi:NAD-dependent deacylase [Treponema sp.]